MAALAQMKAPLTTDAQLRLLITEFLDGAGRNDKAVHQRFWADDVTYTSAKGVVRTKADIMKSLDEPTPPDAPPSIRWPTSIRSAPSSFRW